MNTKKQSAFRVYGILLITLLLVGLTVWGAFCDREIADAVYLGRTPAENPFGVIFAFVGIIPTFVGWSTLGASILFFAKGCSSKAKKRLLIALAILLFVLSFFYFCNTISMVNGKDFPVHPAIAYPVGILVILAAALLGYRLSRRSGNPELLKRVLILTAVSLITMVIIMSTKGIMNRPRFRFLLDSDAPEYFRSFWQSGADIKNAVSLSDLNDEFSSFPSGHSAYSLFAIFIFPALADFVPTLRKHEGALFVLGFVFWCLTALSRMSVGAHYLTDVSIAGLVTVLSYGLVSLVRRLWARRGRVPSAEK